MAPNLLGSSALFIAEATNAVDDSRVVRSAVPAAKRREDAESDGPKYPWVIVWRNLLGMIYLHTFGFYGLYLFLFACSWKTFFWIIAVGYVSGQGITAGAHRLWAHRCYKAKLPLRIILAFLQTVAFQNHIYEWVRDHRVHHKFTDTDADPHNAKRGFFFSHVGWLLIKKHADVKTKGRTVDCSDLLEDPVVRFQKKWYPLLMPICAFVFPTAVPCYCWGEDFWVAWYVCAICRYTLILNGTWLVNSAAHIYGNRPYDKRIGPTENKFVASIAFGEGWHNYHHVFPWDYKASELGYYRNTTTSIIDFFARIGWAYDLKTVSREMVEKRIARTGDGTRVTDVRDGEPKPEIGAGVWGWGDLDMRKEDIDDAEIRNKIA